MYSQTHSLIVTPSQMYHSCPLEINVYFFLVAIVMWHIFRQNDSIVKRFLSEMISLNGVAR